MRRIVRKVRLAAASHSDGLEYGRANPNNNNEEGRDAVSCLLSQTNLDVRDAVIQLSLEGIYRADHLHELIVAADNTALSKLSMCKCRRYLATLCPNFGKKQCPHLTIHQNYNYI